MREALALFCSQYADNVARALRGEPLAPCPLGGDVGMLLIEVLKMSTAKGSF